MSIALPVPVRPLGLLATPDWGGVVLSTAQLIACIIVKILIKCIINFSSLLLLLLMITPNF